MSKELITRKAIERLAELSRIELEGGAEEKLRRDLVKILDYFSELKEVDTEKVEPLSGGTTETNVFREDDSDVKCPASSAKLTEAFPEKEDGFLRVPPVFE